MTTTDPASIDPASIDPASTDPASTDWISVARTVAADLAKDAAERDKANKPPFEEADRLREAGLLTLLIPSERGGGGADWRTAYAVIREIAAGDGSIGQLIGYHYLLSWNARFFGGPAVVERLDRAAAEGRWLWGGAFNPRDPDVVLTPEPGGHGFRLDGRKSFATGARVADRLVVGATRSDSGEPLVVFVDPAHPGVVRNDDWDNFGQRLSASGSVEFRSVPVAADDVIGSLSQDDGVLSPFATLVTPAIQLVFVHFYLGIAEGALAAAADYTRSTTRPWLLSGVESATQDPYVLATYGELAVAARATRTLADHAAEAVQQGLDRGHDLTEHERGEIAATVAAAKVQSTKAALDITARILELTGARSTASAYGFDRFWRNARTHTLHDPVAYKLREVGDHFLNGAHPPFTLYT
ncbi:acyl-CoA dehydrogenase family protein [Streptomyces jeddahensis]|uniref:Dibenzothiophene desulfurization enzyme C n=1 Tax=Streptomyces jeddahensis TaxID=1716141 RepID=A0A177HLX5_9ACTN|nr:acyl-CoA dehydrogenase family protein [Streptomyces jeddahensis]OAH11915.1 dibenzothiophene desulfurization enzyme C [Streptomyces jeddahensis]